MAALPSHVRRPQALPPAPAPARPISLQSFPAWKAYVESLPVGHPDIRKTFSKAYDATHGDLEAIDYLSSALPPEEGSRVSAFGDVPPNPASMSPTTNTSQPYTPGMGERVVTGLGAVGEGLNRGFHEGTDRAGISAMGGLTGLANLVGLDTGGILPTRENLLHQQEMNDANVYQPPAMGNPVADGLLWGAHAGADLVGNMVPYINPLTGALTQGGEAANQSKSGWNVALNAALGAIPGVGGGLAKGVRLPEVISRPLIGATAGGGMIAGQAMGSQLEGMHDLAAQERGMAAPAAGAMGAFELLAALASRGRGRVRPGTGPLHPQAPEPAPISAEKANTVVGEPPVGYHERPPVEPPGLNEAYNPDGTPVAVSSSLPVPPPPRSRFARDLPPAAEPREYAPPTEPVLPDIVRGERVTTGVKPAMGLDGLPKGRPGEPIVGNPAVDELGIPRTTPVDPTTIYHPAPKARPAPKVDEFGIPYNVPGDPPAPKERPKGRPTPGRVDVLYKPEVTHRDSVNAQDPTYALEGFYKAEPRPFTNPDAVDPNGLTRTGTDLTPVDAPTPYRPSPPEAGGARIQRARSETTPNDPYAATFKGAKTEPITPEEPLPFGGLDPEQIGGLGRLDKSLPETEAGLDAVPGRRAEAETENIPPVKGGPGGPLRALSPEAADFVKGLSPGERSAIRSSIEYFQKNPDPRGDKANLVWALKVHTTKVQGGDQGRPKDAAPRTEGETGVLHDNTPPSTDVPPSRGREPISDPQADVPPSVRSHEPISAPPKSQARTSSRVEEPVSPVDGGQPPRKPPVDERPGDSSDPVDVNGAPPKNLGALAKVVQSLGALGGEVFKRTFGVWSKRLYRVVGDLPGGKALGEKARLTLDRARTLMGQFDGDRGRFLKAATRADARRSLEEVRWEGSVGFARIHEVLDKKVAPRGSEASMVGAYLRAFLGTGKVAEAANFLIQKGGQMIKFTADPKRMRAARIPTNAMHWFTRHPKDPETLRLVDEIVKHNPGLTREQVLKEFEGWSTRSIEKRGMAEDARTIENFPTHYKNSLGEDIPLLETDPFKIIDAVTRRFMQRVAYVEHFGQNGIPQEFKDFISQGGKDGEGHAQNLFRALNGIPLDDMGTSWARPGSLGDRIIRMAQIPWSIYKGAKLQLAPLANIPETLGKARAMAGGNPIKFIKAGFSVSWFNRNSGAILEDLQRRGTFTRDTLDWYWNKSDLPETFNRYVMNTTGAVNRLVNEFNERISARMADQWMRELKAGKGGAIDKHRLSLLDFTPEQSKALLAGTASPTLYNSVVQRAVEWAQASTSLAGERSRAGGSRWWNFVTLADRFAQMNVNRNFDAWAKAGKTLADGNTSWGARVKDTSAAVYFNTGLTISQTAAGALTLMLRAAIVGGEGALVDKAFGSPLGLQDYLLDAASYALLGGPIQAVTSAATAEGKESRVAAAFSSLLPVSTTAELMDVAAARGRYQDAYWLNRVGKFFQSSMPLTPVAANVMGVMGLADNDPELNAATREFYKWKDHYHPGGKMTGGDPETLEFRSAMREAASAIKDGRDPSPALFEAAGVRDMKALASSLRAKRLLPQPTNPKNLQQLAEATDYLGERTMQRLREYDAMLDAWASRVYRPKD